MEIFFLRPLNGEIKYYGLRVNMDTIWEKGNKQFCLKRGFYAIKR